VVVGNYNIFQLRITLEVLPTKEEKLKYLYGIKKEIRNIIKKFSESTMLPLRTYANTYHLIDDNCPELAQLIKEIVVKYSYDHRDQRSPSEEFLKRMVKNEIKNYLRFEEYVDIELDCVMKGSESFIT
jgi:hypothetical protein